VVHMLLEGSIEVGEGLCATSEPKTLAQVVTTLGAKATVVAHDAGLDSYSLANHEVLNARTNGGHDASGFVTEDQGRLEDEVAVPAVSSGLSFLTSPARMHLSRGGREVISMSA